LDFLDELQSLNKFGIDKNHPGIHGWKNVIKLSKTYKAEQIELFGI
jgi:hypothetical protein